MECLHRHIVRLTRALLAVLVLVAAIPYRSTACVHPEREESRTPRCCRSLSAENSAKSEKGCCDHAHRECCCSIVPVVRLFLSSQGDADAPAGALPVVRFVSPLRTSASTPPIPPPRA